MFRFLLLAALLLPAPALAQGSPTGVWRNNKDSVRIRIAPCGRGLCGTVVQASEEAREKAAAGGTERLVGTQLFRELERGDDGVWHGEVFVPDVGTSVEGTLEQDGPSTLIASGCLIAGFACKTQTWTRVAGPARRR